MVVASLARQIGRRFQLHVICLEGLGPIASDSNTPASRSSASAVPIRRSPAALIRLRRRLEALGPDVIHTHNEKAHIRGALATLGLRRAPALVHTRHGESRATGWAAVAQPSGGVALGVSHQRLGAGERDLACRGRPSPAHPRDSEWHRREPARSRDRSRRDAHPCRRGGPTDAGQRLPTLLRAARIVADAIRRSGSTSWETGRRARRSNGCARAPPRSTCDVPRRARRLRRLLSEAGAIRAVVAQRGNLAHAAGGDGSRGTDRGDTRRRHAEVVEHGVTGLLVAPSDPEWLAAAMLTC